MRSYKILIVENDQNLLFILSKWLHNPLYEPIYVDNAEAALELIKSESWDCVVSDVNLPNKSGIDLLNEIKRSINANCKVMLISGYATLDMAMEAINNHADMFLLKPFTKEKFVGKLQETLNIKSVKKQNVVLAIGAHPDDVEIGCGGLLIKHIHQGDEVHILTLSYGSKGGDCAVRFNEAKQSALKLGAKLHFENLPDTKIDEGGLTIRKIENIVKKVNPNIVYTHSINDAHQDHRNVHKASIVACRNVSVLECYQSPSSTIQFQPSRFVDISDEIDEKINLLDSYQSQISKCKYIQNRIIEANAQYWGRFASYKLVEPLEVIRTL